MDINNAITVFSIRDVEEALKTPAMFNVLSFIWAKVRFVMKLGLCFKMIFQRIFFLGLSKEQENTD